MAFGRQLYDVGLDDHAMDLASSSLPHRPDSPWLTPDALAVLLTLPELEWGPRRAAAHQPKQQKNKRRSRQRL